MIHILYHFPTLLSINRLGCFQDIEHHFNGRPADKTISSLNHSIYQLEEMDALSPMIRRWLWGSYKNNHKNVKYMANNNGIFVSHKR